MTTSSKVSYYPGCTLKTKARNLEESALSALAALGIEVEELPRWNCCGAVFSLADDDLIRHVAPVRDLIRVTQQGATQVVTISDDKTLHGVIDVMKKHHIKRVIVTDAQQAVQGIITRSNLVQVLLQQIL